MMRYERVGRKMCMDSQQHPSFSFSGVIRAGSQDRLPAG
jgi:hypothetical protein